MWREWTSGFLGMWLILLATLNATGSWTLLITGALIAALGFWSALEARRESREEYPYRHGMSFYAE